MSSVVLIAPPLPRLDNDRLDVPLGLMYLSAYLKQHDHECVVLDFTGGRTPFIPKADIYGFTSYSPSYSWVLEKRNQIEQHYGKATFVVGGAHVTGLWGRIDDNWDYIVIGEGERAIVDIADGACLTKYVVGIPIQNINSIPFPDYSDIDIKTYGRIFRGEQLLSVMTSRGCPFGCLFCNSVVWSKMRAVLRTPGNVVDEIIHLQALFGTTSFRFVDDIFAITESRVRKITNAIKPLDIHYRCTCRVDIFNQYIAKYLADSGCINLEFGIETASDSLLKKMNKRQTVKQSANAIRIAKEFGLLVKANLLIGFPGETWDSIKKTCEFILSSQPHTVRLNVLVPFPGSPIYDNAEEYGIRITDKNLDNYMPMAKGGTHPVVYETDTLNSDVITAMVDYMYDKLNDFIPERMPVVWSDRTDTVLDCEKPRRL